MSGIPAGTKASLGGLGDGVNGPDKAYRSTFPYVADPYPGSDAHLGQVPVSFRQIFSSSPGVIDARIINLALAQPGSYAELWKLNTATNKYVKVGTRTLNAAGTATSSSIRLTQPSGTSVVLFWRVFVNHGSAQGMFPGLATTINSR